MECKDCMWLRMNVRMVTEAELPKNYGKWVHPCNRFPQNIMRAPKEPACGEFKKLRRWKFLALTFIILLTVLCGCASMRSKAFRLYEWPDDPNRVTSEYYEASYETFWIDWERHGFRGVIEGFGSVGSARSRVESEGGGIVEDLTEVASPIKAAIR